MSDDLNDNAPPFTSLSTPDPHGQAAYLLVESLIHTLVKQAVITRETAVELVDVASDVRAEIAYELGDTPSALRRSLALLTGLMATLTADRGS